MLGRALFGICLASVCICDFFWLKQPNLQIVEGNVIVVYHEFVTRVLAPISIMSHGQNRLFNSFEA